jgi:hypothetical protein
MIMSGRDLADLIRQARVVHLLFDQGTIWTPAVGGPVLIANLDYNHARNLLRWLRARASYFHFMYGMGMAITDYPMGEIAADMVEDGVADHDAVPPLDWMTNCTLYRAVQERVNSLPVPVLGNHPIPVDMEDF